MPNVFLADSLQLRLRSHCLATKLVPDVQKLLQYEYMINNVTISTRWVYQLYILYEGLILLPPTIS
jgi:hypothetical protein